MDPLDKTVVDIDGTTLRIYGLPALMGPPSGQIVSPSVEIQFSAGDIGHVFALAFDNEPPSDAATPGLYAGATSMFGLNIVGPDKDGDGQPDRLPKGAPQAKFVAGQFGPGAEAGPGSIWKIDRATGALTLFTNLTANGFPNSGAGIGGLAFDPKSRTLYASDLDTGLIHRLSVSERKDLGQFDHGVTGRPSQGKPAVADNGARLDIQSPNFDPRTPATWGITQPERRIDALAVHNGRLFYAVAEGPQIWSVGLGGDGSFSADVRFETSIKSEKPFPITGLAFDRDGNMIIAQRAPVQNPADYSSFISEGPSQVLRLKPESPEDSNTPGHWLQDVAQEYAAGDAPEHRSSDGGVTLQYAYRADGTLDTASCNGTVIFSTDAIGADRAARGLQITAVEDVRPANVPPKNSAFLDWDPQYQDATARGYAGGVAALQVCGGDAGGVPPIAFGSEGDPGFGPGDTAITVPPIDPGPGPDLGPVPGPGEPLPGNTLLITKSGAVDKCSPQGGCAFNIEVLNPGPEDVPGPIVVDDQIDAPQAALLGEPVAPWSCTNAAPFTCTHPGPVPANSKLDLRLEFAPNTPADIKEVKNCAVLGGGGDVGDEGEPGPNPNLPLPPPPAASNNGGLTVEKRGIPATCDPAAGTCEFEVKITNNTGQPINQQPLKIFDTMSVGSQTQAKNQLDSQQLPAGLVCTPQGREFNCSQDALTLAPNASLSFKASFKIDTSEGGPAGFVTNKAFVTLGPLTGEATASIAFDKPVNVVLPEPDGPGGVAEGAGGAGPQKACATIPIDPDAPVQAGPITTAKKGPATCTANAPCAFTITVTNTSDNQVNGPIVINDTIDAPQAAMSSDPNAPWTCTKAAPFTCTHPGPLAAKQAVDLNISFTPNTPADIKQIKNCAVPKQPAGNGAAAAPAPEQCAIVQIEPDIAGGPKLTITKKADPCVLNAAKARFECNFVITVANTGDAPFKGPVTVQDTMPLADGLEIGVTTAAPWSCPSVGDAKDGVRACKANDIALEPQASTTLPLQVTVPSNLTGLCLIANVAKLTEPAPANDNPAASVAAQLPNKGCAPSNLVLTKTATPDCVKNAAGNHLCTYKIAISNASANPFKGKIEITDDLGGPVPLSFTQSAGPWECQPKNFGADLSGARCATKSDVSLEPFGAPLELDLTFEVPDPGADPGKCKVSNFAFMTQPPGLSVQNHTFDDDFSAATAKIPMVVGPDGAVPCDPPSLKLTKTANPQVCVASGDVFDCSYDVTVLSLGPDPFHGPLKITETLPEGAQFKTASAPWACTGASNVRECTHPFTDIAVGSSLNMAVTVHVPKSNVKPGACSVNNRVRLSLDAGRLAGQTFDALATARIEDPICSQPAVAPACTSGMVLTNGICSCPSGTTWNGRQCIGSTTTSSQPAEPAACKSGMILVGTSCQCPPNSTFNGRRCVSVGTGGTDGTVMPPPPPSEPSRQTRPPPPCPRDFVKDRRGRCVPVRVTDPPVDCPGNQILINGRCRTRDASPPCPAGYEKDRRGRCVPVRVTKPPLDCPGDQILINGICRPPPGTGTGGADSVQPGKECPPGYERHRGRCAPKRAVEPDPKCPAGQIYINGKCRPWMNQPDKGKLEPRKCPPGYRVLDKPNKYGAYCELIPKAEPAPTQPPPDRAKCVGGKLSRSGQCICPPGTLLLRGKWCRPIKTNPAPTNKPKCAPGQLGTPPNCCKAEDWNPRTKRCEKFTGPR